MGYDYHIHGSFKLARPLTVEEAKDICYIWQNGEMPASSSVVLGLPIPNADAIWDLSESREHLLPPEESFSDHDNLLWLQWTGEYLKLLGAGFVSGALEATGEEGDMCRWVVRDGEVVEQNPVIIFDIDGLVDHISSGISERGFADLHMDVIKTGIRDLLTGWSDSAVSYDRQRRFDPWDHEEDEEDEEDEEEDTDSEEDDFEEDEDLDDTDGED